MIRLSEVSVMAAVSGAEQSARGKSGIVPDGDLRILRSRRRLGIKEWRQRENYDPECASRNFRRPTHMPRLFRLPSRRHNRCQTQMRTQDSKCLETLYLSAQNWRRAGNRQLGGEYHPSLRVETHNGKTFLARLEKPARMAGSNQTELSRRPRPSPSRAAALPSWNAISHICFSATPS